MQAAAPAAVPVSTAPASTPAPADLDSLRESLAEVGLTLAVTDPEKLRAAQESAAQAAPAPRPRRERKPLPPAPAEPLVQVETRH